MNSKQLKMEEEYENPNKENEGPQEIVQHNLQHANRPPLTDITEVLYPKKKKQRKHEQHSQQQQNIFLSTVQLR